MSTGLSISGAISGIDTATMINQLVSVDAAQQTAIKNRQAAAQKAADAYSSLIASMTGLAGKAQALARTSDWQGSSATSSSSSVKVSSAGSASGALTFDVTSVATKHTLISADAVASTSSVVADSPLRVLDAEGNQTASLNVGTGTLAEVVNAINTSSTGLRASAVQTSPGQYRLQIAAGSTGVGSEFSLDPADITGFSGFDTLTQGKDASITVGDDPDTQYSITSSSNTFAGVVPGLSFTVSKEETNVTVESVVDGTAVATQIKGLVDAANGVLADLAKQTAYNASTKTGGALLGESSIRQLQQQILGAVGGAGAPGVQLTRTGTLTFDQDTFLKAFAASPEKTAGAYGATAAFTPAAGVTGGVSLQRSMPTARAGHYAVQVAVAAARETWKMDPPGGNISGQTVVMMRGSTMVSYTVGAGEDMADAVAALNARAASSGLGVSASTAGASIILTAVHPGAAQAFSVTMNGAPATKVVAGADVQGTIDGEAATGVGNLLSLTSTTSRASGLTLQVDVSAADVTASGGEVGSVEFKPGLAQRLSSLLSDATDARSGSLARAKETRLDDVKDLQDAIDAWDRRLENRRATLQRQFTAMETAMGALKTQTSSITSMLG